LLHGSGETADYPTEIMVNRSSAVASVTALVAAVALLVPASALRADAAGPLDPLARLKAGNARFVADASAGLPITADRRAALVRGQTPFASVLSCADSRVPPEVIFHTGLGDLFVVRSAGHVPDRSVLASLEYGAEHLHTPLLVVMGHELCGAVKAAIDTPASRSMGPNLDYLLKAIRPATARTASQPADIRLRMAILANVEEAINALLESSSILRHLAERQQLTLAGAYYELATGRAHFSEPVGVPPSRAGSTSAGARAVQPRPSAPASTSKPPAAPAQPPAAPQVSAPSPRATTPAPTRAH
jgi:carbonic anhydrase